MNKTRKNFSQREYHRCRRKTVSEVTINDVVFFKLSKHADINFFKGARVQLSGLGWRQLYDSSPLSPRLPLVSLLPREAALQLWPLSAKL